jgi:hypothetical protein
MKLKFLVIVVLSAGFFSNACSMNSENQPIAGRWESFKERFKRSYLCDNFKQVGDDKLYRSGALSSERLEHYIKAHGLKTVINLRNYQPDVKWWQDIKNTCTKNNVQLIDLETSCYEPVKKEVFEKLIKIFKIGNSPILIMDKGGVVRTGEIAALWLLVNWNEQEIKNLIEKAIVDALKTRTQTALKQLSILKGYVLECYYGKKAAVQNVGDCIAKKLAHDFVSMIDLKDPFQNSDFVVALLDGIYPTKK